MLKSKPFHWLSIPDKRFLLFILIPLGFLLNFNTLDADFVFDDTRAILENDDVLGKSELWNLFKNDFWGLELAHSGSHKSYRPLCVLSFRLTHQLFSTDSSKIDPTPFHVGNLVLYLIVNTVLYRVLCFVFRERQLAQLCALLFACHPVHCESVASVVGRAELGSCLFSLLALLCHLHLLASTTTQSGGKNQKPMSSSRSFHEPCSSSTLFSLFLTSSLAFVALLWKEQGITVLAICSALNIIRLCCRWFSDTQRKELSSVRLDLISLFFFSTACAAVMYWRLHLQLVAPVFSKSDNPIAVEESLLVRTLTFLYLPVFNLKLLLCPDILSFDWSMDSIPLIESFSDNRVLLVVIFYSFFVALALRLLSSLLESSEFTSITSYLDNRTTWFDSPLHPHMVQLYFAFCFLVIPFLPSTNLFFYVGFVVAERVLFMPSIGYCILVTTAYYNLCARFSQWKRAITLLFVLLIITFFCRTLLRNADWKTEQSLYKSGISVNPAKAYANLANVHFSRKQYQQAEFLYFAALSHRPNMGDTHYNLGVMYQEMGQHEKAILSYQNAIDCRPFLTVAYSNMGDSLEQLNLPRKAEEVYKMALKQTGEGIKDQKNFQKGYTTSCFNLAKIQFERNESSSCVENLELCINAYQRFNKPVDRRVLNLYGRALGRLGKLEEARKVFKDLFATSPNDEKSLLAFGSFLVQTSSDHQEIETLFTKIFSLYPKQVMAHDVYGFYLLNKKLDFHGAVEHYKEVIRLVDSEAKNASKGVKRAVINLGHAYRHLGDYDKAEELFRQSTSMDPKLVEAHSNLGAVLHLQKKYLQAKEAYLKALELDPHNQIASSNLEKVNRLISKT